MLRNLISLLCTVSLLICGNLCQAQCNADAGPDVTLCSGSGGVTIGGSPSATGAAPFTYSWSPATNLSCTNCANPVSTTNITRTYTLTITDNNGCTDTDQITVTVASSPTASFTFSPNNQCSTTPVVFANTSTGSGLTYAWNFGDPASGAANTSTLQNPTHTFVAPGNGTQNFTVTLTVTNAAGCTVNTTQTITVNQSPDANLLDPFTEFKNCSGSAFTLQVFDNTTPASNNAYTINWGDATANFTAGAGTFPGGSTTHNYTTMGIYTLTYTVTGTNGCTDTETHLVSNITNPAIGVANPGNTNGCGPLSLCFPLSNFAGNHTSTTYRVDYGDGSPFDYFTHPPPASICHTYSESSCGSAGNAFTFAITARNNCDSSTATVTPIRVYTTPEAHFSAAPNPGCVNTPILFTNTSIAGFNSSCSSSTVYTWSWGDASANTTAFTNAPQTHTYTAPGNYTVTLSAQNSCGTTTESHVICIEAAPVPAFTVTPAQGCFPLNVTTDNTTTTLNTCNVTYNWIVTFNGSVCLPSSGNFAFTNGTNASSFEPQFVFNDPGNYTITLQVTNSCGMIQAQQPITVFAPPQISMSALSNICAGQSVTPSATFNDCSNPITTYAWTFPTGSPATSAAQSPGTVTYNSAGNKTITVTATNSCGSASANTTITVSAAPAAPVVPANTSVCAGDTIFLTAGTIAGATYSWTGPNGFTSALQNPIITNAGAGNAGVYTVSASVGGCPGPSSSTTVNIVSAPVVSITPANPSICAGNNVTLTANGATTYVWSPTTGLSAGTGANVTANPATTTTYTVNGTSGACAGTATVTVTVNPLPTVNAGPDMTVCNQPVPTNLTGTPAGGTWSGPGVTAGGVFTPSATGTFTLTYSFTDGNNCTATDNMVMTVVAPTPANAGADFTMCHNTAAINLNGTPAGGTWSGTNVNAAGSYSPATVGTFTLTYSAGSGSCLTTDNVTVTVNPLPVVTAPANQTVCIDNGIINLTGNPSGGPWSGNGVSSTGVFDPLVAGPGSHVLTYTHTDPATFCTNFATTTITVNALPVVSAGPDITVCDQPIATNLTGTPAGGTWSGTGVTAGGSFTPTGTGTFTLTYTFTNAAGCTASDNMVMTVVSPTPANAGPDFSTCLNAAATNLAGTPAGGTWSGTNVTAAGVFTPSTSGTFVLTYSTGTGTCLTTDNLSVTVNALPVVNAGNDQTVCVSAAPFNLNGTPAGGTWTGTGITNPSAGTFNAATAGIGTFTLTYSFTDANGCTNTDNLTMTVNALPVVNAGVDTTICNQPPPVTLSASPAGGTWSGPNISAGGTFTPSGTGNFTVTYTFTQSNGCSASDDRIVTVVNPVQAIAGADDDICHNSAAVNLTGLPAGGSWSGTNVTGAGVFTPSTVGTFTLTYTVGVGNCQTSDQMVMIVNPLPTVNAGNDLTICQDGSITNFAGTPAGGTWSGTGITNASAGTFNPAVAGPGSFTITYTFTNPLSGCVNSDNLIATVNPLPVIAYTHNPIACVGTPFNFTNTTTGSTGSAWTFGDGGNSAAFSPVYTYSSIGTYTIQLISTSAAGCDDTLTSSVDVLEPGLANFTLAPDSGCGPVSVNFTNLSSGQGITFSWDFGNGNTSTLQNPAAQNYQAGIIADTTYFVTLNVTNFCATVTHTDSVIVMPKPTAVFGPNVDIGCSPLTLTFANNSLGLPDNYFWDFGDGTTSTTSSALFTHTFTTGTEDTTYTITLIVQNECGSDTVQHTITVLPNTVNAFFNTDVINGCSPLPVNFTQFSTGATFYSWDFGDGNFSVAHSPSHTYANPGVYQVQLFINDGCSFDTAYQTITVNPPPAVAFTTMPDSVCANQAMQFINQSTGLAGMSWDFGDGNTSTLTNPTHTYAVTGTYLVTLTGTSVITGCTGSITQPVQVNTTPVAAISATPSSGCVALPVTFTNNSTSAQFYSWDFGDGNTSGLANPSHTYAAAGTYNAQLVAENINGCTDTTNIVITVFPLPVAAFTPSSASSCNIPVTVQMTNNSSGATSYAWDFGNTQTSVLNNPQTTYAAVGSYDIELIATNQYGCTDTANYTYVLYPLPQASFTVAPAPGCANQPVTFTNTSTFGTDYFWDFGDGNTSTLFEPQHAYADSGVYSITLVVTGLGGCGDTLSLNNAIQILPSPVADFSYINVQNVDPLSGTVEFTNLSTGATDYTWYFGNGNTSSEENPIERYRQYGTFLASLVAVNQYGCTDTMTMPVIVEFFSGLFLPNAIYPGNPNFEVSHFVPKGVGLKTFHLAIYDDWGNRIWETSALDADGRPTESWDGTFNGVPVQQDAYVWKVEALFLDEKLWQGKLYPDGRYRMNGTVTVIR